MPFKPQTKKTGDLVQSQDWNDAIEELLRLEKDKVNRSGNDNKITGPLTIEGALSAKEVTFSGALTVNNISVVKNVTISSDLATLGNVSIGTPTPENGHGWNRVLDIKGSIHTKLSIRTNNIDGRVLAHDSGFWGAPGGMIIGTQTDHPLSFGTGAVTRLTILSNGNVGIGTKSPVTKLDISSATRTGTHPTTVKGLYVTGDFLSDREGVEFRHSNGMEGIGFGYNTIYAAGSKTDQDLGLQAKGTGKVQVFGKLSVSGNLTVSGKVNDRDISADGLKLDAHTHNGTDSQKVKHSNLTLDGGTNPHKTTAADVGALSNKGGTVSGSLSIVVPQLQDQIIEALVLGPTNASNLRLGYHQDYSLIQSHGSKPLLINKSGNNIGIGSIINPVAKLDIASATRTGTHPTAVKGLYITGDFKDDSDGVEFRHTNGTQGIGFGSNTIYAAGSNANQDLGLKAKGTGKVKIDSSAIITGNVGIGTQDTTHRLTISSTDTKTLRLIGPGKHGVAARLNFGDNEEIYITEDEDKMLLIHADTRITLDSSKVGIGTNNPTANLDVKGDVNVSGKITVKSITTSDWIAPTLENNWLNWGTPDSPAGYFKDSLGIVHLRGVVKNGRQPTIFTLPDTYRPAYKECHAVLASAVLGRVDIQTDGKVVVVTGNYSWISLDGITFRAKG